MNQSQIDNILTNTFKRLEKVIEEKSHRHQKATNGRDKEANSKARNPGVKLKPAETTTDVGRSKHCRQASRAR